MAFAIVGASILLLSACGASGPGAPTRNNKQVSDGAQTNTGSIAVRDIELVAQPDGSATLIGTFINETSTPDALTGITVNGVPVTLSATSYPLLLDKPVIFGGQSANATGSVPKLGSSVGTRIPVVITFQSAPSVTLSALILAN